MFLLLKNIIHLNAKKLTSNIKYKTLLFKKKSNKNKFNGT